MSLEQAIKQRIASQDTLFGNLSQRKLSCWKYKFQNKHQIGYVRVGSDTIRNIMGIEETIAQTIERRQLIWYGHVRRMIDVRLPKVVWKWKPLEGGKSTTQKEAGRQHREGRGLLEVQALSLIHICT